MRYEPQPYKDKRLERNAQLGRCLKCSALALYCGECGEHVEAQQLSIVGSHCANPKCSHQDAKYGKLCPKHRSEKQLQTRKRIKQGVCPRCRLPHPGPGCLYRKFREEGIRKLTQEQIEWVWTMFMSDPVSRVGSHHQNILATLPPEKIADLAERLPFDAEGHSIDDIVFADSLIYSPEHSRLAKEILWSHSYEIREGMWCARELGKTVGRPKRSRL